MDYKKAGVDIQAGELASKIAYDLAKTTFASRNGMIGEAIVEDGSFAGLINMGDFYLVQNDDGVGTKIEIAIELKKFDTLGYDLLAMVADDTVCLGAETISITDTLDANKIDVGVIRSLMKGLAKACQEQKVLIPGGEIAELGNSVNSFVWNATAVGILKKNKVITGSRIKVGDKIIALKENGFRSNGFSLVRHIMENKFKRNVYKQNSPFGRSWGAMILEPSTIYSADLLKVLGRFGHERKINITGLAHITGGGIPGNLKRILKRVGLGAELSNLFQPSEIVNEIQKMGKVTEKEAYQTWNMGNGMLLVVDASEVKKTLELLSIESQVVGEIISERKIVLHSRGAFPETLSYDLDY
ncbi:MAG: phosphoribosylformylglycinamidine cyclo-ligase [Candidatus Cloacimonetes bacterium]|nr:phosphoribosylformylglycinamidine cyclo-ligase [Candidatus Cloacimonadota bacterium]